MAKKVYQKFKVIISKPDGELIDSFWALAHSGQEIRDVVSDQLNIFDDENEANYCLEQEGVILDRMEIRP